MNTKVTSVIIIPSYNETLALPELLAEISIGLTPKDAVIIMDDSTSEISKIIKDKCQKSIEGATFTFYFDNSGSKSGRGAAIRRGMIRALNDYPEAMFIMECDADGSHQAIDILKIKNSDNNADLLIGSRYLPSSEIIGWPMNRRIFSWILNNSIPRVTSVYVDDITNGLRRYSREAVRQILSKPQINTGFVYLSEQAVVLTKRGMKISEEPIIFIERTLGKSTVTWREITNSLLGIMRLVINRQKL